MRPMTKKDYIAIAQEFANQHSENALNQALGSANTPYRAVVRLANRVADVLAADNPRFDRERFLAACENGIKD